MIVLKASIYTAEVARISEAGIGGISSWYGSQRAAAQAHHEILVETLKPLPSCETRLMARGPPMAAAVRRVDLQSARRDPPPSHPCPNS